MKTNFIRKHRLQLPVLALALLLAVGGGMSLLNRNVQAAELPAGTLLTNFVHPDLATAVDGSSFTFTADVDAAAVSCVFNLYTTVMGGSEDATITAGQVSKTISAIHSGYSYGFTCLNSSGDSDYVEWLFGTPNSDNPTTPILVSGYPVVNADGSVTIKWNASTDSDGIASYYVSWRNYESSCSTDCQSDSAELNGSTTEYTIPFEKYSSWQLTDSKLYLYISVQDNHSPAGFAYTETFTVDTSDRSAIAAPSTEAPISKAQLPIATVGLAVVAAVGIAIIVKRQLSRR